MNPEKFAVAVQSRQAAQVESSKRSELGLAQRPPERRSRRDETMASLPPTMRPGGPIRLDLGRSSKADANSPRGC